MDQHQIKITGYLKDPHTVIFTRPISCGKSHLVLDVIEKNTASILTSSSLFAQCSNGQRRIMRSVGSDMITMFGLSKLKTSYSNE